MANGKKNQENKTSASLKIMRDRIQWLMRNGSLILLMLDHVTWAMDAITSLPPMPQSASMQQLYQGFENMETPRASPKRSRKRSSSSSSSSSSSTSGTSSSCSSCRATPKKVPRVNNEDVRTPLRENSPQPGPSGTRSQLREKSPQPGPSGTRSQLREKSPQPGPSGTRSQLREESPQPGPSGTRSQLREKSPQPGPSGTKENGSATIQENRPPPARRILQLKHSGKKIVMNTRLPKSNQENENARFPKSTQEDEGTVSSCSELMITEDITYLD